jgi:hypothetical protein
MNMKKTYINPTIEVMKLNTTPLLTNSVTSVDGLDGVTTSETEFTGGEANSRYFDDFGL